MFRRWILALAVPLCWPAGCASDPICDTGSLCDKGHEGDADTDTDSDTDSDTDTDTHLSESVWPSVWYAGDAQTGDTGFVDGHFGTRVTGWDYESGCESMSTWSDTFLTPPGGCPGCVWSFSLQLSDGTASGDLCDLYGVDGTEWDGFVASWGFAPTYDYDYNGTLYPLDTVLFYYSVYTGYEGWQAFAYNYAGYGYNTGDARSLTFMKYAGSLYYY